MLALARARYALNLLHAHELRGDYEAAFAAARAHLLRLTACGLPGVAPNALPQAPVCKHGSLSALLADGAGAKGAWSVAWREGKGGCSFAVVTYAEGDKRAESDVKPPKK